MARTYAHFGIPGSACTGSAPGTRLSAAIFFCRRVVMSNCHYALVPLSLTFPYGPAKNRGRIFGTHEKTPPTGRGRVLGRTEATVRSATDRLYITGRAGQARHRPGPEHAPARSVFGLNPALLLLQAIPPGMPSVAVFQAAVFTLPGCWRAP